MLELTFLEQILATVDASLLAALGFGETREGKSEEDCNLSELDHF